jgi:Ca-activated chloride channel family protein
LWFVPDALQALALVCLMIGLARPQGGDAREVLRGQGIDLVFVLDISGSMAALDFEPVNRLEAAKAVIGEFLDGRAFDRIGVVTFARDAYVLVPLTLDYAIVRDLLARVRLITQVTDASGARVGFDGTNPSAGMAAAEAMMRDSRALSRVVVVLTDGDYNAGIDPVLAAEATALLGVRTYTIGIGRTGEVPFPTDDGGVRTVESDLDEAVLQAVATAGGGAYFRAEDTEGLRGVIAQIDRLERSPVERQTIIPWQDWAWGWVWMAFGVLMLERVLRVTVWRMVG